jgi:hypothetical protein
MISEKLANRWMIRETSGSDSAAYRSFWGFHPGLGEDTIGGMSVETVSHHKSRF